MKRQRIFKLTALLLPFIFLAVIEIILCTNHYGYDTHLFTTDQDARFWVMNRDISKKYFTVSQNATIGNQEVFYKKKPAGTLRFFVLGASSSLGFPYMHNGSFVRMLKYKLQFQYPGQLIEVINLSLTAINSYTLSDFAKQIVRYQPDGVLVYAGHNEYYGALGVASSSRLGRNHSLTQILLGAKDLKLVQGLLQLADSWTSSDTAFMNPDLTLMERMATRQMVPFQSGLFKQGVAQFDRNIGDILQRLQRHHIPVFIGTLACNLKDQPPLGKQSTSATDAGKEYQTGRQAYALNSYEEARTHYLQAKEYDELRFRAPEEFNNIIQKYARKMDNVFLVDISGKLAASSPNHLIGNELMLEHVHPNLAGHRLIADAFFETLQNEFFTPRKIPTGFSVPLTEYPATVFDSIYGDMVIGRLKQQWPFNEPASGLKYNSESVEYQTATLFFLRKINWGEAMLRLNNHYIQTKDLAGALRIVEQMCLELPHEKAFLQQAGSLSIQLNRKEKAVYYFKQASHGN